MNIIDIFLNPGKYVIYIAFGIVLLILIIKWLKE